MQTAMIPQITCKTIHRMNRNFLWGDTRNHSRCHTIGWDMITRPKEEGKRFKHLKKKKLDMNIAMLTTKLGDAENPPNSLWLDY